MGVQDETFDTLTAQLLQYEHDHGMSTIEAISRYLSGQMEEDDCQDWIDTIFLYFGVSELKRFH